MNEAIRYAARPSAPAASSRFPGVPPEAIAMAR